MQQICRAGETILVLDGDGYRFGVALGGYHDDEQLIDPDSPSYWANWREVVTVSAEVARAFDLPQGEALRRAAISIFEDERLANCSDWLVSVGQTPSVDHNQAFNALLDAYPESDQPSVRHQLLELPRVRLVSRDTDSGTQFLLQSTRGEKRCNLTAEEVVLFVAFVLSDKRTEETCPDQFGPFFVRTLAKRLLLRVEAQSDEPPVTSDEDDWESKLRGRFENVLARHGL